MSKICIQTTNVERRMYYLSESQKTHKKHRYRFFFKTTQCQFLVQMQMRHDMPPKMHDQLDRSESVVSIL